MNDLANPEPLSVQPANTIHKPATPILDNGVAYEVEAGGEGATDSYGPDADGNSEDGTEEVLRLRAQLLAHQRAMLDARRQATSVGVQAAIEQQKALKKAQEDAAKAKAEAEKIKRQAAEAADAMVREIHRTEDRARRMPIRPNEQPSAERDVWAARIASLESEVAAAKSKNSIPRWQEPKFWMQMATLALLVAALVRICISPTILTPTVTETWRGSPGAQTPATRYSREKLASRLSAMQQEHGDETSVETPRRFEDSVQRIMVTVAAFPDRSFQDLVSDVNRNRAPSAPLTCPFQLGSDGSLALVFDKNDHSSNPLVSGLTRCAEGLEKLRLERLGN